MLLDFNFVSIPRTGSQSVYKVLGITRELNHHSITRFKNKHFSFAFLREPTERLYSWYYFHRTKWDAHKEAPLSVYNQQFEDWIKKGCPTHWSKEAISAMGLIDPMNQYEYISDHDRIAVDCLGDFKRLQQDFNVIMLRIGKKQTDLEHTSFSKANKRTFNEETMHIIKSRYKTDFELYENIRDLRKGTMI